MKHAFKEHICNSEVKNKLLGGELLQYALLHLLNLKLLLLRPTINLGEEKYPQWAITLGQVSLAKPHTPNPRRRVRRLLHHMALPLPSAVQHDQILLSPRRHPTCLASPH